MHDTAADNAEVLIVGAGPAGLMLGALLANEGRQVVVLESGDVVGGRSATIQQDGYSFEMGPHATMDNRLRTIYAEIGRSFERSANQVGWLLRWEGQWCRFQDFYAGDVEAHEGFVELIRGMSYEDLVTLDQISVTDWVSGLGLSERLAYAYTDLAVNQLVLSSGSECSAAEWVYCHKAALDAEGRFAWADVPVGGYSAMLLPLVDHIREKGGDVITGRRVTRVLTNNGTVTGVAHIPTARGFISEIPDETVTASGTVAFTAPVIALPQVLETALPRWYRAKLSAFAQNRTAMFGFFEGRDSSLMGREIRTWWGNRTGLPGFAISPSEYEPTTSPDSSSLTWFGVYPDPQTDLQNWSDIRRLQAAVQAEINECFPGLDDGTAWRRWYSSADFQSAPQRPGFTGYNKPEVVVPGISGLYLAGDGVRGGRGIGVENAAGSALRARRAIVEGLTAADLASVPL
jgi:phytoene dehydrogenase-like protein